MKPSARHRKIVRLLEARHVPVVEQEGHAHDFIIQDAFHILETTVCCVRRRLIPLCVCLLPCLKHEVDVQVKEQSPHPPYPVQRIFEVGEMERNLLASALWENEALLSQDSRVNVSIRDPNNPYPGEIRLVPPGMLLVYNIPSAVPFIEQTHSIPRYEDPRELMKLRYHDCPLLPDFQERLQQFLRQIHAVEEISDD